MKTFTIEQQMLSLALASYQGFWMPNVEGLTAALLGHAIAEAVEHVEPLGGHWRIAWGPASFRSPDGLLDDALAFVARDDSSPPRYAVVIRGTNPLSLTDWIFGDAWVLHDDPWAHGTDRGDARISRSSALGLTVIQNLCSAAAEHTHAHGPLALLERAASVLKDSVANSLHALGADFDAALRGDPGALDLNHFRSLAEDARQQGQRAGGVDLQTFLRDVAAQGTERTQLWVTGHSKGGALATAVALWLADTRSEWDPHARVDVNCLSFAGPTVGNAAFAARVTATLGGRHQRVANERDLVPQGWSFEGFGHETSFEGWDLPVEFQLLARKLAGEVTAIRYAHVDSKVTHFTGEHAPWAVGPVGQLIYQHLYAYITHAGLTPAMFRLPAMPQWAR